MKSILTFLLILILTASLYGQERPEINIQEFIENIFQIPDEDVNYADLYESLYQLYTNPIDLNNTNKNELNSLYNLNVTQINNLIQYIEENHPLISIFELQVIEGFDQETIDQIRPFVEVRAPGAHAANGNLFQRIVNEKNNYFILRTERILESQEGYLRGDSTGYHGSPYKMYARFRTSHSKDFSLGLTFEKDAGEAISWNPNQKQYGFDYYSFHVFLENRGNFKKIAIGDYQMQFGQGLVVGSGFNPGKGAETITTVRRGNSGIRPYTSVLESGFMRGAAFSLSLGKDWLVSPFYSYLKQDGSIHLGDGIDEYGEYISSIQDIGLHRTTSELASRDRITEHSFGMNITYSHTKSGNLQAGITMINTHYSLRISKTPNNYNQFEFQGNQNSNVGIFVNYNWQNFLFFGESAISKSGGHAHIAGFMASISSIFSLSFSLRSYDKNYHSFYGNSFGEGTRNINEKGMYWGLKIEPSRKFTFSAFYDRFKFPWLKYRVDAPSEGYEYLLKAECKPTKKLKFYIQYREQSKEYSISYDEGNINTLVAGVKRSAAANINIKLNEVIGFKTRIQYSTYGESDNSNGMVLAQDLNLSFDKVKISARYALFDTEDYENRQYLYENDLLYAFSIPAYFGQGSRSYLLAQYKPSRKLTFWLKYGIYRFNNLDSNGSGLTEINGNKKSELKFQLRFSL